MRISTDYCSRRNHQMERWRAPHRCAHNGLKKIHTIKSRMHSQTFLTLKGQFSHSISNPRQSYVSDFWLMTWNGGAVKIVLGKYGITWHCWNMGFPVGDIVRIVRTRCGRDVISKVETAVRLETTSAWDREAKWRTGLSVVHVTYADAL